MLGVFLFNENIMYWEDKKAHGKILLINKIMVTNDNKIIKKDLIIKIYPCIIYERNVKMIKVTPESKGIPKVGWLHQ